MKFIKLIPVILVILSYSCGETKLEERLKNEESVEKIRMENEEKERIKIINEVSDKFNSKISFDTVEFKFTYQYQNFLKQNNRVIIEDFEITNIDMKDDSSFFVSIKKGYYREKFIEFTCTKSELNKICEDPLNDQAIENLVEDRFLILKLNSVEKVKLKIESFGEDNGDDEPNTYITIKASEAFIFKAEFIDTYLKNKK